MQYDKQKLIDIIVSQQEQFNTMGRDALHDYAQQNPTIDLVTSSLKDSGIIESKFAPNVTLVAMMLGPECVVPTLIAGIVIGFQIADAYHEAHALENSNLFAGEK